MQSLGITDSHYMRTRGAARTGAAPRDLDPAVSPTLTVGATHGRGSEPIAGPHQVQHHPLQQPTARQTAHRASLDTTFASPITQDVSPSVRSSRTALRSQRLTPTQLEFVSQVENRLNLKADAASQAMRGAGDAGVTLLSPAVGDECKASHVRASPARPQPLAATQHRSELETLRCRLNEQQEQLATMSEKIGRVTRAPPGSLTTAEQQGGFGPIKGDGTSPETGTLAFPHPAPATERSSLGYHVR